MDARRDDIRKRASDDLRRQQVVMEGHFDYGNGFHGGLYLNPHQLFRTPSLIWRVAQDLIDITPWEVLDGCDVVAGPVTGGALLAHTVAGLLDGRRAMTHPPYEFAPFVNVEGRLALSPFYSKLLHGRRVVIADDVRNTGQTIARCAALVEEAGGTVVAALQIVDRGEAEVTLSVPNITLIDYKAPPNYPEAECPLCRSGVAVTRF